MRKIYHFLASPKLAFILIIAIAILAFIGSFIPQGDKASVLVKLAEIFDDRAESVFISMQSFGIDDIYHSKLFIILLALFALNLILCTVKLLPFAIKGYSVDKNYAPDILTSEVEVNKSKEAVLELFAKSNFKGTTTNSVISAEKHESGRYGVIILHTGILLVLFGAFVGYINGFKGFMNVLEGSSDNVSILKDGTKIELGFELALREFDVEYYPRSDRAKSYTSIVDVLDKKGEFLKSTVVDVNHPLTYKDITFYQTNFGFFPRNKEARFKLSLYDKDRNNQRDLSVDFHESFKITDNITATIVDFAPALAREGDKFVSVSDAMINPAILVEMYESGAPLVKGWITRNNESTGVFKELGFILKFNKYHGVQYSGFSVRKDPGRNIVYLGFSLIAIGFLFIYLLNYTIIFFQLEAKGSKSVVKYRIFQQRKHALTDPSKHILNKFKE